MICGLALWMSVVAAVPSAATLEKTQHTGPVESVLTLEPSEPVIGDDVTLTLRVTAEKGVELIMPEFGAMLEEFVIVDFSANDKIDGDGRTVITQRYVLQPSRSGRQSIPPILVEYVDRRPGAKPAPDGMDAYEHLTERLDFSVKSVLPADAKADLHPPLGALAPLESAHASSRRWWWIGAAAIGCVIAVLVWRFVFASRRLARQRSAFDVATARLDALLNRPRTTPEELDAFFVELSAIVRGYLEHRFDLRAPELTTEEFLDLMVRSPDLSRTHQDLLRGFLRQADLVKFAQYVPAGDDVEQSIVAARRFLEETRHVAEPHSPAPEVAHA